MILSNTSIHQALDDGRLIIEPEPSPRFPTGAEPCPYNSSAVDLRLGREVSWLKSGLPITIDLRKGGLSNLLKAGSEIHLISHDQPYTLHPGQFVLAKTMERVYLPILEDVPCLAARVEGRSSYARCGLLVHFTAPTIHAGFEGTITLEMINHGPQPIALYPETPICQLIIEEVHGRPFPNESQFQGQTRPIGTAE